MWEELKLTIEITQAPQGGKGYGVTCKNILGESLGQIEFDLKNILIQKYFQFVVTIQPF